MTIIQANQILLEYFMIHDAIKYEEVEKLIPKGENKELAMAALIAALQDSSNSNILAPIQYRPNDITSLTYILKKPLIALDQNVQINGMIAFQISNIINNFAEISEQKEVVCNPLNVTQQDIMVLLDILNMLSDQLNSDDSPISETIDKPKK